MLQYCVRQRERTCCTQSEGTPRQFSKLARLYSPYRTYSTSTSVALAARCYSTCTHNISKIRPSTFDRIVGSSASPAKVFIYFSQLSEHFVFIHSPWHPLNSLILRKDLSVSTPILNAHKDMEHFDMLGLRHEFYHFQLLISILVEKRTAICTSMRSR
jgi:hypothetical protein